jgi:hypothetical protein
MLADSLFGISAVLTLEGDDRGYSVHKIFR